MLGSIFANLSIALGLGLLVGLQKERTDSPLAGLRTFALASLMGAVAALLTGDGGPWLIIAGLISITGLMIMGNAMMVERGDLDPGQTTEVAIALTYLVGALTVTGPREVAIVLGATTAMLLHLRQELRGWVQRLSDRDVRAMMQFVVISLVILPVLPNETYGPYDVLNPRQVWWMVVLIVGLNLAGYAAFRMLGTGAGAALAGVLGGAVSSTATTISFARQTKVDPARTGTSLVVIWIASGVLFVRILIEIGAVAPGFLPVAGGPLAIMLLVFAVVAGFVWYGATAPAETGLEPTNPTELKPALLFAALYAAVLLAVAAAQDLLGATGLYVAAAISGLTDLDAITLSTSRLVSTDVVDPHTGWRLILVAAIANMTFKAIMVTSLGGRSLAKRLTLLLLIPIATALVLIAVWPR